VSLLQGITGYYEIDGWKGLLAISSYRLFGSPAEITVHPPQLKLPVHLRVRTSDPGVYRDVLLGREYDLPLPFSPRHIVDCGANIGMASIFFADRYPQARIIALEPEPSNFEVLMRNVSGYPNILPIHAALWKEDGELGLCGSSKIAFQVIQGRGVRAISMNTLMQEAGLDSIDLLKVDIEGAEKELFEACDWIQKVRALAIELHDRFKPGCRRAVESVTMGYMQLQHGETTLFLRKWDAGRP